ncbi:MAG: nickel-dependent lactate racemase [Acidobacteria bacterium]|nr:MAG: nickel-dependent lactate racemase [Acidobacteriota bacterium]
MLSRCVPYIDRALWVRIPDRNLIFEVEPGNLPGTRDVAELVLASLRRPQGSAPLTQSVKGSQRVVIISDDNTRRTPTKRIIPLILDELNRAGIPDSAVSVVISSGTHRAMTSTELDQKYGREVISRVPIIPHRYKDPSELVDFGTTGRGIPIVVNRHVIEADFRIAVGEIVPHHPAGWGGGAKAVLPGVAGEETVARMHLLGSRYPGLGVIETEMRREMEDLAGKIGLNFIVNAVLNREGDLVAVVGGQFVEAHREGVALSQRVYGADIPELVDMTLSSTSPVDFDFFQGDKGITSAELSTRPGGEIILVSGCLEGISTAHPELGDYLGQMSVDEIWEAVEGGNVPDRLTCAEAIVVANIAKKMRITLVTEGITRQLARRMGFGHQPPQGLQGYIDRRLAAEPELKIGILRNSAEILPMTAR